MQRQENKISSPYCCSVSHSPGAGVRCGRRDQGTLSFLAPAEWLQFRSWQDARSQKAQHPLQQGRAQELRDGKDVHTS